jgi:hypothetical protein
MSDVIIRRYRDGDEFGIIELFKKIFGRDMTIDEWRWKYKGLGNKRVYSFVITDKNDKVVGHYGGIPLRMLYKGKEITGITTCDVMIDERYRGMLRLKRLHNAFVDTYIKEGIYMFYGFPTEKTLLLPAEKLNLYERVEQILEASKDVEFRNSVERFIYKIFPLDFDDPAIDRLWHSIKGSFDFGVIRDRNYLVWRYKNNPLFSYEIWGLKKRFNKELSGLVIFKKEDKEGLLLMDLIFKDNLLPLLTKTENLAYTMKKRKILLWLPQRMHHLLKGLGYVFKPSGAILPRARHPETIKKEDIISYFYYTCGDTDFL